MRIKLSLSSLRADYPFWILTVFVIFVFLTGGGARDDVQSLVILRPLAVLCLGIGLWSVTRDDLRPFTVPLIFGGLFALLIAIQLVPLPPAWWMALPGREIAAQAADAAGMVQPWRPINMSPYRGVNSLFALAVPAAAVVLAIRCSREQRSALLPLFIVLGVISGFIGLLQAIGSAHGPLYFYAITNNGSAVGFFANRNHQAMLLASLFPMLAVYASVNARSVEQARVRRWTAIGLGVFVAPLLIVTGSRAGLALGALGLILVPVLYRRPVPDVLAKRKVHWIDPRYIFGGLCVVIAIVAAVLLSRARVLDRITAPDQAEELRFAIWGDIARMVGDYFPFGSGSGSFVEIYQIHEGLAQLSSEYVNHAHNDWLEVAMTLGLPGVLLLLAAGTAWCVACWRLWQMRRQAGREALFARLGCALVLIVGAASVFDYPLRVPSIAVLFVIAVLWIEVPKAQAMGRRDSETG